MSGRVRVDTWNVSHTYHVVEYLPAPLMIEPERLFGLHQYHLHSYIAEETCRLLTIDKQDVMRIATTHLAVRLNLLNAIATKAQRHELQPWRPTPQTVDNHIVRFFATHALYPAGKKVYHIKMKQLASELNDSREDISRALHRLQSRGLVTLARGRIIVEALEACLRDG